MMSRCNSSFAPDAAHARWPQGRLFAVYPGALRCSKSKHVLRAHVGLCIAQSVRTCRCTHPLLFSLSLCVHAHAHRTPSCPWLDAEGFLPLCQIAHQIKVAGPPPPNPPAILPVQGYCHKAPLQVHRCLDCAILQCFSSSFHAWLLSNFMYRSD